MIQQILKTNQGKWAVALASIAVIGIVSSVSKGSTEAIPGALVLLAIVAVLVMTAIKAIQNPLPAPTLEALGIHISQEQLDAFVSYGTLPRVENTPVILANEEQAVYACRAVRVETKNRKIGTTGGAAGASISLSVEEAAKAVEEALLTL